MYTNIQIHWIRFWPFWVALPVRRYKCWQHPKGLFKDYISLGKLEKILTSQANCGTNDEGLLKVPLEFLVQMSAYLQKVFWPSWFSSWGSWTEDRGEPRRSQTSYGSSLPSSCLLELSYWIWNGTSGTSHLAEALDRWDCVYLHCCMNQQTCCICFSEKYSYHWQSVLTKNNNFFCNCTNNKFIKQHIFMWSFKTHNRSTLVTYVDIKNWYKLYLYSIRLYTE